jgi:superfamily II DNA helicase RecQ
LLSKKLLHYFGETHKKKCDACSNCLNEHTPTTEIITYLKGILTSKDALSLEDLSQEAPYKRTELALALQEMCAEEMVTQNLSNQYVLI